MLAGNDSRSPPASFDGFAASQKAPCGRAALMSQSGPLWDSYPMALFGAPTANAQATGLGCRLDCKFFTRMQRIRVVDASMW